jgi:hypothetical protein
MTPDQKNQVVLAHEGQVLALAGGHGAEHAGAITRCMIDGAMNGLLRIEGREAATVFAFAVCDRISLGLKGRTSIPIIPAEMVGIVGPLVVERPAAVVEPPKVPVPEPAASGEPALGSLAEVPPATRGLHQPWVIWTTIVVWTFAAIGLVCMVQGALGHLRR